MTQRANADAFAPRNGQARRLPRKPVEKLLPSTVLDAIHEAVRDAPSVTTELIKSLGNRFDILKKYGVSEYRLRNFIKRFHSPSQKDSPKPIQPSSNDRADSWQERVGAHRRRQASVASILDSTFGQTAACNPDLWERRAFLMIMGIVYERLATLEKEIETDDLVVLAKILAEQRRAEARKTPMPEASGEETAERAGDQELPERFADVVRQVYGADLHGAQQDADAS